MQDHLSEDLKTVFLAGIGMAAITVEKAKEIITELVEKGRLTVDQGRVLNEELHRRDSAASTSQPNSADSSIDTDLLLRNLDHMSREDLAALKAKLAAMETAEEINGQSEN